jgi:hypothetical protein
VFLRTRVLTGEIDLETEQARVAHARQWIEGQLKLYPHLSLYLQNWGDWSPWI